MHRCEIRSREGDAGPGWAPRTALKPGPFLTSLAQHLVELYFSTEGGATPTPWRAPSTRLAGFGETERNGSSLGLGELWGCSNTARWMRGFGTLLRSQKGPSRRLRSHTQLLVIHLVFPSRNRCGGGRVLRSQGPCPQRAYSLLQHNKSCRLFPALYPHARAHRHTRRLLPHNPVIGHRPTPKDCSRLPWWLRQ